MTFDLEHPSDIYRRINEELEHIIQSLQGQSKEQTLNEAQAGALEQLNQYQEELSKQLTKLENNAEWNTFTIAFYGETGAGKSSIIETLRILLCEPSKMESQTDFRALRDQYGLSEESLQQFDQNVEQANQKLAELTQHISSTQQAHEQEHQNALQHIENLRNLIAEHKRTASLWQKLLHWFRKLPEEIELATAEQQLPEIVAKQDNAIRLLIIQQTKAEQHKETLIEQRQKRESRLGELKATADGSIIGEGRQDFTRQTTRYDFEMDGHKFALMDVPGIEGKEELVLEEIEKAVQRSHAVFYVTNQAAPPQTGEERKGTLEKIKEHLGSQTEVWTIFNKKIANPMALKQPLVKKDEQNSLMEMDKKMREQLGKHYRKVFPLSALPAFLASTDHFVPNSQNAKRRNKFLDHFGSGELLEISRMRAFIQFLNEKLLGNSEARIKAANFSQAKSKIDESNVKIQYIQKTFSELAEKLGLDAASSCQQLQQSFRILQQRLKSRSEQLIGELVSNVRHSIYRQIEQGISNDTFKISLASHIEKEQERFRRKLPEVIHSEVEIFQKDAEDIIKRFEEHSQELASTYERLSATNFNGDFEINIKMDNGLNVWGLLGGVVGLVAAPFTGGASLWVTSAALLTTLVGIGKAVWGAFSASYKKAQQRKSTDENLRSIREKMLDSVRAALDESMPEMQKTIAKLEQALNTPGQQAAEKSQILKYSTQKLDLLSRQISHAGNLS